MPGTDEERCSLCGRPIPTRPARTLSRSTAEQLADQHDHLHLAADEVCEDCVGAARTAVMRDTVREARGGQLTDVDEDVIAAVRDDRLMSEDAESVLARTSRPGRLLAERVAAGVGSWEFVTVVGVMLFAWVLINLGTRAIAPWPTAFLALTSAVLAALAAIQAPVILMSQRRRRELDRIRAELEYRVNLKAELEIRELSERVDRVLELLEEHHDGG